MSAELLRTAAKWLRDRAAELPERVLGGAWEQDSSEIYAEPDHEWVGETLQDGGDEIATYVVLMHPPVALALASVLDGTAEAYDEIPGPDLAAEIYRQEIALARAILREAS